MLNVVLFILSLDSVMVPVPLFISQTFPVNRQFGNIVWDYPRPTRTRHPFIVYKSGPGYPSPNGKGYLET